MAYKNRSNKRSRSSGRAEGWAGRPKTDKRGYAYKPSNTSYLTSGDRFRFPGGQKIYTVVSTGREAIVYREVGTNNVYQCSNGKRVLRLLD